MSLLIVCKIIMRILLKLTGDLFGDNERAVSLLKSKEVAEKIIKIKKADRKSVV